MSIRQPHLSAQAYWSQDDTRYLKLACDNDPLYGDLKIAGTENTVAAPTNNTSSITYLNPSPTVVSATQTNDAGGTFETIPESAPLYVWGINTSGGDKDGWSSCPDIEPFTDDGSAVSAGDPSAVYYAETYTTYTIGDPTNNSSYIDTTAGGFINDSVDFTIWGYATIGGVQVINSATPATFNLNDSSSSYFQYQLVWTAASGTVDGYIVQAYDTSTYAYYYIDVGNVLSATVSDPSYSGWNNNYYTSSGLSSFDYGGQWAQYSSYTIYLYSFNDQPEGRAYSNNPTSNSMYFSNAYRGLGVTYSPGTSQTGVMMIRLSGSSYYEYKEVNDTGGSFTDDGTGWSVGNPDVSQKAIQYKFYIDFVWSSSDYSNFLVAYQDDWNSSGALRYKFITGATTTRLEDSGWDLLSNDATLETWVNAHLTAFPTGTETADGVARTISVYAYKTYLSVTAYSPVLDFTLTPDSSGKSFYMTIAWIAATGSPNGYKIKYTTNYKTQTGITFTTANASYGASSTLTPTTYYTNAKIYSDYWSIDETGYTFIGTGSLGAGTLTDATTATHSGVHTFTNGNFFKGSVTQTAQGYDRISIGVEAGTPRMVFEDYGGTTWLIDSSSNKFRWYIPGTEKMNLTTTELSLGTNVKFTMTALASIGSFDDVYIPTYVASAIKVGGTIPGLAYANAIGVRGNGSQLNLLHTHNDAVNTFTSWTISDGASWNAHFALMRLYGNSYAAAAQVTDLGFANGAGEFGLYGQGASRSYFGDVGNVPVIVMQNAKGRLHCSTTEAVFNDGSNDYDFRVETNGQTHAIFADAGNDSLNFFTPTHVTNVKFNINGITLIQDKLAFTQTDLNEYIDSLNDGFMDYGATTAHRFLADVKLTADNRSLILGAGDDCSIYYDGTNMLLNPRLVGTGYLSILGDVVIASDTYIYKVGAGLDMSIGYTGTVGRIDASLVAASDLQIDCGTDKTLVLDESVYNDANVGGLVLRTGGTAPGVVEWLDNDGDATGLYTIGFADGETGSGSVEIPHDYKEGTNLVFHIHYGINAAPSGTDQIRFDLIYNVQRDGTTFVDSATIDSADVAVDTQYKTNRIDFTAITGTNFKIGDQFNFTLKRTTAVGDAFTGEVLIQTLGFHYETDTMGSRQIGTK